MTTISACKSIARPNDINNNSGFGCAYQPSTHHVIGLLRSVTCAMVYVYQLSGMHNRMYMYEPPDIIPYFDRGMRDIDSLNLLTISLTAVINILQSVHYLHYLLSWIAMYGEIT